MLTHAGTQKIETQRLILRKFEAQDAGKMYENWARDTENCDYMSWSSHKNIKETEDIIKNWIKNYNNKDYYHWAIVFKEKNELIGSVTAEYIVERYQRTDLGYIISKKYWCKGFMTEALKAVIIYLFEKSNFERIQAYHYAGNSASGRVMEKCGMKYEGTLRKFCKNNRDEFVDATVYGILKEDQSLF